MGDGFTDHGSLQPEQIVLPNGSSLIPQLAKQAEYMDMLREKVARGLGAEPDRLRRDQLNIVSRMAEQHAQDATEKELLRMRLAQSPEEVDLILARIEAERDLGRQRRASAAYDEARTADVGKQEPEDVNTRMRNAATLLNSITRITPTS